MKASVGRADGRTDAGCGRLARPVSAACKKANGIIVNPTTEKISENERAIRNTHQVHIKISPLTPTPFLWIMLVVAQRNVPKNWHVSPSTDSLLPARRPSSSTCVGELYYLSSSPSPTRVSAPASRSWSAHSNLQIQATVPAVLEYSSSPSSCQWPVRNDRRYE